MCVLHDAGRAPTTCGWNIFTILELEVIRHNDTGKEPFDFVDSEETPRAVEE
jgi:hypothetical protein